MKISTKCDHCEHSISVPEQAGGLPIRCPFCGFSVLVPKKPDLPEAAKAPEQTPPSLPAERPKKRGLAAWAIVLICLIISILAVVVVLAIRGCSIETKHASGKSDQRDAAPANADRDDVGEKASEIQTATALPPQTPQPKPEEKDSEQGSQIPAGSKQADQRPNGGVRVATGDMSESEYSRALTDIRRTIVARASGGKSADEDPFVVYRETRDSLQIMAETLTCMVKRAAADSRSAIAIAELEKHGAAVQKVEGDDKYCSYQISEWARIDAKLMILLLERMDTRKRYAGDVVNWRSALNDLPSGTKEQQSITLETAADTWLSIALLVSDGSSALSSEVTVIRKDIAEGKGQHVVNRLGCASDALARAVCLTAKYCTKSEASGIVDIERQRMASVQGATSSIAKVHANTVATTELLLATAETLWTGAVY